jgi:hypothetical protein
VAAGDGKLSQSTSEKEDLLRGEWDWCNGPLIPILKKAIQHRRTIEGLPLLSRPAVDRRAVRTLRMVAELVADAVRTATARQIRNDKRLKYLSPNAAVEQAVEALYN